MSDSFRILIVCADNVCGSPLAAQMLARQLRDRPEIEIASAGTQAVPGSPMTDQAQKISRGLEVPGPETHRARQLTADLLDAADLVLTLSRDHRRAVAELSPRALRRVFTIREFARLAEKTSRDDLLMSGSIGLPAVPAERLRNAVRAVTYARSDFQPAGDPGQDDVTDAHQRSPRVYTTATRQLTPAVKAAVTLFHRVLEVTPANRPVAGRPSPWGMARDRERRVPSRPGSVPAADAAEDPAHRHPYSPALGSP